MKACPTCSRLYPDDAGFCPVDGQSLRSATQVPVQASDDERVGTMIANRYQVRRVVADGGMGRVYEALDTHGQRRVAVKMLHNDVAIDEVSVERFKREFEVSQGLPHEHIVEVTDFQREGRTYALVMEFLDGEELRTVMKREKTITPGRLVRMCAQIAIGLEPAHARQLIHRDLKPDNVFLVGTREGDVVKLLDFGSVKDKSENAKKLTVMGTTIGSPYYMSPEQAQGLDTIDRRADVWSVAAIAYEAVTGKVPFPGTNGPTILLAILTKDPIPPTIAGEGGSVRIPPALDDVMDEALAKTPAHRIADAMTLAARIGAAYGLQGTPQEWAQTPQHVLDERIGSYLATLPTQAARPAGGAAMADPFAAPGKAGFQDEQTSMSEARRMELAMRSAQPEPTYDVPSSGLPGWVIPVAIGGVFLVVGVILAVVLL